MAPKLRMLILRQLESGPRAGYGLTKDIHKATGWKPSFGSLYPELACMYKQELIVCKEEGKKKIYSLTKKGKQELKKLAGQHGELVKKMRENYKFMMHLFHLEEDPLAESMFQSMEQGKIPLNEFIKESSEMKKELFRLYQKNSIKQNEKRIRSILNDATKELRQLS